MADKTTSGSSRRRDSRSRSPDSSRRSRHRSRSPQPRGSRHDDGGGRRSDSHKERDDRRSRDDDRDRRREREREKRVRRDERSDSEDDAGPPEGVKEIGEDDYFVKATELKLWLWEEKGKKLDNLKTEDARRYFRKFCRAWNRGRLSSNYYNGISPASLPSSISTSHSWSFAKASQADLDAAATIRRSIDTGSKTRSYDAGSSSVVGPSLPSQRGPALDPSMPPPSSAVERLQLERDVRQSASESERSASHAKRKRETRDARDEERDNRATGRDRLMEKRREGNASRRDFESSREAGMQEFDDDALMGGSTGGGGPPGSFADAVRERERAQQRRDERRKGKDEERKAEMSDKLSAFRAKEDQTMAMFREMAAKRFG